MTAGTIASGLPAALGDAQALFARLCTDADALAAFDRDPAAYLTGSSDAARSLGAIDRARLRQFARSLRWKRAREARQLLPFTSQALGDRFWPAFFDHAKRVTPNGSRKPLADAMAFTHSLQKLPSADRAVRQAARYDWLSHNLTFRLTTARAMPATRTASRRRGLWLRLARFDFAFPEASAEPRRRTVVLFVSAMGRSAVWYW